MPGRRHFLQFTLAFGGGLTSSALAPRAFSDVFGRSGRAHAALLLQPFHPLR